METTNDIYTEYKDLVAQIIGKYINDPNDYADFEQEVWLRILEKWDDYDPKKSAETTFIHMVADHAAIDLLRQAQREPELVFEHQLNESFPSGDVFDDDDPGNWLEEHSVDYDDPESLAIAAEERGSIEQALEDLPEELSLVWYRKEAGMSEEEIASLTGVSVRTIRRRYAECISILQNVLT